MLEPVEIVKKSLLRRTDTSNFLDYGKLPPQAKDLEEAVLGAIMIDSGAMVEVAHLLNDDMFYLDAHQRIFRACRMLYAANSPIDLLTVTEQLKKNGELDASGGPFFIAQLTNKIGSSANIGYHAQIIAEKSLSRNIISVSTEAIKGAYEDTEDPFEIHANTINQLDSLLQNHTSNESFYDMVTSRMTEVGEIKQKGFMPGVKTYLENLDHYVGSLMPGEFIIVAGRPAMGKSALMVDFAYNQAKNGIPVGIFSLEMTHQQLIDRFISAASAIPYEKMRKNSMSDLEYSRYLHHGLLVAELPINIDDTGGIELNQLCAKAKLWKHKKGIKILYVDYLQLVEAPSKSRYGNREQEISTITRKLKMLAKDLEIPIVGFSQLSRKVEERQNKRPVLSDLRESGSIEQDADMVFFPFRPSYYKLKDDTGRDYDFTYAEMIFGKFRGAGLKDIKTPMEIQYSRFIREGQELGENLFSKALNNGESRFRPLTPEEKSSDETPF